MAIKVLTLEGLTYFASKIKAWVTEGFVAKESGKGLSTNDYTTAEKNKLAGVATGAQVNVVESVKVNGSALAVSGKGVNIDLSDYATKDNATTSSAGLMSATDKGKLDGVASGAQVNKIESVKVNGTALTISSKAVNIDLSSYATKSDVSAIPKFAPEVVTSLPTSNISTSTLYLIANNGSGNNAYDEYIYANGKWEKLGTLDVDLSGYVTDGEFTGHTGDSTIHVSSTEKSTWNGKQDKLTAGTNITISGTTISAKDTTYEVASTSANGLMSASDKSKLDAITASADAVSFTRNLSTGTKIGTITINGTGTDLYCEKNTDTTYNNATTSTAGLMSASDKTKLDGVASTYATKEALQTLQNTVDSLDIPDGVVVDSALSSTSTNPVQNKVINSALAGKLSTSGTAAKATADANGNNIVNTYATKAQLGGYVATSDMTALTTAEIDAAFA